MQLIIRNLTFRGSFSDQRAMLHIEPYTDVILEDILFENSSSPDHMLRITPNQYWGKPINITIKNITILNCEITNILKSLLRFDPGSLQTVLIDGLNAINS